MIFYFRQRLPPAGGFHSKNHGIDLSKEKDADHQPSVPFSCTSEAIVPKWRPFLEHLFSTKDPDDLELILNKLTTNYTYFLRENDHFTYFQTKNTP